MINARQSFAPVVLAVALLVLSQPVLAYSDAGIDIQTSVNATCPCTTLTPEDVNVIVTNMGTSRETYELSLVLPDEEAWSGFITPSISLFPDEKGSPGAIFITPSCSVEPGVYTLGVAVSSKVSDKAFIGEFDIEVLPCHWIGIEADVYELCQGIDASFEIKVTNDGISDERVKVSASEDWVTFPVGAFDIGKGEEEAVEMRFSPPADEAGIKRVIISVESSTSYASVAKEVITNIRECYSASYSLEPGYLEVCPCQTGEFILEINNTGLIEDVYAITYENRTIEVDVAPGEDGLVQLSLYVPCDKEDGDYPLAVTIRSRTPGETGADITVMPLEECYSVDLSTLNGTETVSVGKAVTYRITITNEGKFSQAYELLLDAPDWVHLSEQKVELIPGESKDVYLYAAPNYFIQAGSYSASVSAISEIEQDVVDLKVDVESGFSFDEDEIPEAQTGTGEPADAGPDEVSDLLEDELGAGNITMNMSIPTGGILAGDAEEEERPWTQIMMLTILAMGVAIILILRFVVLIK